jgi:hypothetical protein
MPPMAQTKIDLDLELELDRGRLSGRVGEQGGDPRAFTGWLGLIGAIDALVEGNAGVVYADEVQRQKGN